MSQAVLPEFNKEQISNNTFYIGEWLIQPTLNRICRQDKIIKLAPKMMESLLCFTEHAGNVVTKEDLMRTVWKDTFVSDSALTRTISELRKAFGDDSVKPRIIETIHKKGYRLIAPISPANKVSPNENDGIDKIEVFVSHNSNHQQAGNEVAGNLTGFDYSEPFWKRYVSFALGLLVLVIGIGLIWFYAERHFIALSKPQFRLTPLTTYEGNEIYPAISPNGESVAFSWNGETKQNFDIYVKRIGSELLTRLTHDSAFDAFPAWSPDGKQIAFIRRSEKECGIYTIAISGENESKLKECRQGDISELAWSPDGNWIAYSDKNSELDPFSIFLISLQTSEKLRITSPTDGYGDTSPVFSPDGQMLAFRRTGKFLKNDIYTVSITKNETARLTFDDKDIQGFDWSQDGNNILFASNRGNGMGLWQIPVSGGDIAWIGLPIPRNEINGLSVSRKINRFVLSQKIWDLNIWQVNLSNDANQSVSSTPIIKSTEIDAYPKFSPDSSKIAFVSNRRGKPELWVCDRDGSNLIYLASLNDWLTVPGWSPDGTKITFTDGSEVFTIDAEGGTARRIMTFNSKVYSPIWSSDGQWIFFTSASSGIEQTWKIPAVGGETSQMTNRGGIALFESPDGQFLFYLIKDSVWKISLASGEESFAFEFTKGYDIGDWAVCRIGIFFINREKSSSIDFFDFATQKVKKIADSSGVAKGITVSQDGQTILFSQVDRNESDLLLFEKIR